MTSNELELTLYSILGAAARVAHERRKAARKGRNAKNIEIAEHMCSSIDQAYKCVEALEMSMPMVFKTYDELMGEK
jgi:hypothetical protein